MFLPETYEPVLLARKAARKRRETGDERYFAAIERREVTLSQRVKDIIAKPFVVLLSEPMLVAITVYMAVSRLCVHMSETVLIWWGGKFVYGCMYMLFEAYPIVFELGHHMNAGLSGVLFL